VATACTEHKSLALAAMAMTPTPPAVSDERDKLLDSKLKSICRGF
jgi:hypothetical protein